MKRGKRTDEIYGSYLLPHAMNRGKEEKVLQVLRQYRRAAEGIQRLHLRRFFEEGSLSRFLDPTSVGQPQGGYLESPLSDRYLWVCSQQVVDMLKGHLEHLKNRVREILLGSSLPREKREVLLLLNSREAWLKPEVRQALAEGQPLVFKVVRKDESGRGRTKTLQATPEDLRLLLHLFRRARKELTWPGMHRIQMHLDGKVVRYEPRGRGRGKQATHFPAWLHLATLEKGKRVAIPLGENPYAEGRKGEWRDFFQVGEENGRVLIRRVKALSPKPYTPRTERLAVDIGLSPLIATDRGDLLGRGFLRLLAAYDTEIQTIAKRAQREGRKLSQVPEYREAMGRLRGFLKNEVNRLLNRLVALHAPAVLVVERLDLRSPELSRRMNRLLSNFGRRYLKEKLARLGELYGIKVVEVNPAYSSQACSRCGYVDPRNRRDTQTFVCQACGHRGNAQVNAARNLLRRSSPEESVITFTPKRETLRLLLRRYAERSRPGSRLRPGIPGGRSAALEQVWGKNPYLKGFPDLLRTLGG